MSFGGVFFLFFRSPPFSYSLISQYVNSLPWLSSPTDSPCSTFRLPHSALRPMASVSAPTAILEAKSAWRVSPVLHSPGLTMLMMTPVLVDGAREARWRIASICSSFDKAYLDAWWSAFSLPFLFRVFETIYEMPYEFYVKGFHGVGILGYLIFFLNDLTHTQRERDKAACTSIYF